MANQLTRYATVATVDTAGEGGFFGGLPFGGKGVAGTTLGANDRVRVHQFVLPFRTIIRNIVFDIEVASASGLCSVGLYDVGKNLFVHTGAISTTTDEIKNTAVTAVTLEPGIYYLAWTGDNNTFKLTSLSIGDAAMQPLRINGTKVGRAANSSSSGVLPATLGAITVENINVPAVYFEP